MESELPRHQDLESDEQLASLGLPSVIEGEHGEDTEKKSILKNVKAEADKIKETIKEYVHVHDQDEDKAQDNEKGEEAEVFQDPKVQMEPSSEEPEVTPILASFKDMNIRNELEPKPEIAPESHLEGPEPILSSLEPEETPRGIKSLNQSGYLEKISLSTSTISRKAMAVRNIVAEYIGEKFRPSEEDRALSKAIAEAVRKGAEEEIGEEKEE